MNPTADELAKVVMGRLGLEPRKRGSTERMHKTLVELYERAKVAHREKKPEAAVMTVEEMGMHAGITRQTMYDYLRRWLDLNMIVKMSYIQDNAVVIGYKLNGSTLEAAFEKAQVQISKHMSLTGEYISQLQKLIKNEKIRESQKQNRLQIVEKKAPIEQMSEALQCDLTTFDSSEDSSDVQTLDATTTDS